MYINLMCIKKSKKITTKDFFVKINQFKFKNKGLAVFQTK